MYRRFSERQLELAALRRSSFAFALKSQLDPGERKEEK
jgi:hypothetical protein